VKEVKNETRKDTSPVHTLNANQRPATPVSSSSVACALSLQRLHQDTSLVSLDSAVRSQSRNVSSEPSSQPHTQLDNLLALVANKSQLSHILSGPGSQPGHSTASGQPLFLRDEKRPVSWSRAADKQRPSPQLPSSRATHSHHAVTDEPGKRQTFSGLSHSHSIMNDISRSLDYIIDRLGIIEKRVLEPQRHHRRRDAPSHLPPTMHTLNHPHSTTPHYDSNTSPCYSPTRSTFYHPQDSHRYPTYPHDANTLHTSYPRH
jgi:hypothetical protein